MPHASYIGHHNGPQYFGCVTNNPATSSRQHGRGDWHPLPHAGLTRPSNGSLDGQGTLPWPAFLFGLCYGLQIRLESFAWPSGPREQRSYSCPLLLAGLR